MFLKPKIVNSIVEMTYGGIPDPSFTFNVFG